MAMNNMQDDQADQAQDMSVQQEYAEVTNLRPTVGDELRMRREEAGHTIVDLAEALRIQKRYLEALEDGRIDDLPGTVYALGFLRTYAEYYGLDGDAFVTRFKEETEGRRHSQEYVLPEPLEEARVPTAAIALIGIALAIGAIVVWYSMRPPEAEVAGAVPELPTHLVATAEDSAPASEPASTSAETETAPAPAPAESAPASSGEEPAVAAATSEPQTPPPAPEAKPVPAPAPAPVQPSAEQPEPEAPVAAAPVAAPEPASSEEPAQQAPAESDETVAAVSPAPAAPAEATGEEIAAHVPQVYGGTADARIVITAVDDSWLEITDAEGNRLMSRTLRIGDSYRVPNRDGLVFVTGNAGGLSIAVDGEPTPALGGIGIVRKNVKLDPELLKEGRAWP